MEFLVAATLRHSVSDAALADQAREIDPHSVGDGILRSRWKSGEHQFFDVQRHRIQFHTHPDTSVSDSGRSSFTYSTWAACS
ncbi:MAG: hypothetical protein ABWY12_01170, partial [Burkholderiales bacterium]